MANNTFTTRSNTSIKDICDSLQKAANSLNATVENAQPNPFSYRNPKLAIKLSQHNFLFGPRKWGVLVYVYDEGDYREIELIALGDGVSAKIASGFSMYRGENSSFYELGDSINRRDRIIRILQSECCLYANG